MPSSLVFFNLKAHSTSSNPNSWVVIASAMSMNVGRVGRRRVGLALPGGRGVCCRYRRV